MTRKHFVAIAKAFADSKPDHSIMSDRAYGFRQIQWEKDVTAMAGICASSNPNFNRQRFYDACGMEN